MARDYKKEAAYENSPQQVKNREARNRAHAAMERKVGKAAMAGKDVDHKKALKSGGSNSTSNLRLRSVHANRGDKTF
jgi:hypothetical protein